MCKLTVEYTDGKGFELYAEGGTPTEKVMVVGAAAKVIAHMKEVQAQTEVFKDLQDSIFSPREGFWDGQDKPAGAGTDKEKGQPSDGSQTPS